MHEIHVIHHPPCPDRLLKGLGLVAGIAAISITAFLCYEHCRKRGLMPPLASKHGSSNILPALHAQSEAVLRRFDIGKSPLPDNVQR